MSEQLTITIIVAVVVLVILFDIVAAATKPDGDTITQVIQKYSQRYPIIPFAFGLLAGHLYGDF